MSRSGWKWPAVGLVSLLLVLLGAHLAWEWHRVRLHTPKGTIRIGMTREEAEAVFGENSAWHWRRDWFWTENMHGDEWVSAAFDPDGHLDRAAVGRDKQVTSRIPRPSLLQLVRSWLTSKGE